MIVVKRGTYTAATVGDGIGCEGAIWKPDFVNWINSFFTLCPEKS